MNEFERVFRGLVNESIATLTASLADGQCEDLAQYRRICGVIEGLNEALGHADIARKKIIGEA